MTGLYSWINGRNIFNPGCNVAIACHQVRCKVTGGIHGCLSYYLIAPELRLLEETIVSRSYLEITVAGKLLRPRGENMRR